MKVFWSTPTISRPRSWIAAIVEPVGMAPDDGCGPGRRLASASVHCAVATSGAVVISCAPAGLTGCGAIDTDAGGVDDAPHPVISRASPMSTTTTRVLIGTP